MFVNSELAANRGTFYELENGVSLQGARIHYFDIDKTTKAVVDSGVAYGEIYDRAGNLVTAASQLTGNALRRFCSGALMEEEQFGAGNGLADRIYFAGEENSNGSMWALDTDTGTLWEVPEMGRGGWENVTQINTGNTTDVAFLLADDTTGAPLYLYIGRKDATGDFLDRNGLRDGQLYVWKADNAAANSPAELVSGSLTGTWVAIEARDPAMAGQTGYDALGYKNDTTLRAEADALGAFTFSRPEDVSTNPANGAQVVFASTGASIAAGATADGVADATDAWGTVYTLDFNFLQPALGGVLTPAATSVNVLYNGNTDATRALRSPDNLDWADDGMIYVQEDRSTNWAAAQAANGNEASIVRINPNTGAIERVAVMDRTAVPAGQTDGNPADFGNWESSGILDVSELFGLAGGSLFIGDVQAHSIGLGSSALVEGGQLFLLAREGVDATPVETTQLDGFENVIGTGFADMIGGNAAGNLLEGRNGDDLISGLGGDDTIIGGAGNDQMSGGAGNDLFFVDSIFDRANEVAGEGSADRIYTTVGYQLLAGSDVEDIVSIAPAGIGLAGNELNNKLFGASGNDTMFGLDGNDMLDGRAGNDQMDGGAGADTLNGSLGNDLLFGQAGNDVLDGGNGIDVLWGGAEADIFQLTNAQADRDVFGDFTSGADKFEVRTAFFGAGLDGDANGVLDANRFTANATGQATAADQRFVYNTANNFLYFDADGSGAGARQLIGVVANGATLAATDFIVTGAPAV